MQNSTTNSIARRARLSTKSIAAAVALTVAAGAALFFAIGEPLTGGLEQLGVTHGESRQGPASTERAEVTTVSHEAGNERLGPNQPTN